jgi:hypothetical protein
MKLNTRFPFFLFLLPVFFFLHRFVENFVPDLWKPAGKLALLYIGISVAFALLCWLLLRDFRKAALVAFTIMSINFFFGDLHDLFKRNFPNAFFVKYSVILAAILVAIGLLLFWLKRTKRNLGQLTVYLNLVLVVLIVIDCAMLVSRVAEKRERDVADLSNQFVNCDTCSKPDIYLIVADEYAGKKALRELMDFDNSAFENELRKRGFYVADSSISNYNATSYSMASFLSMDYIKNLEKRIVNHRDLQHCRQFINNNNLLRFLRKQGYTVFNNSYFNFDGKKKAVYNPYYPSGELLLTYHTLYMRLKRDLGFHFLSVKEIEQIQRHHQYNNKKLEELLHDVALKSDVTPKLVYTHLAMPHHPYYYDRNGREYPYAQLTDSFTMSKTGYTDYLLYANNKLLQLIDHIRASSKNPPVIMLISDHGFRQVAAGVPEHYWFSNLQAVYLPGQDYSRFYHGMSNVNLGRVVLNTQFRQQLPMLKDSTSFLRRILREF